jgi:hypothetical protein
MGRQARIQAMLKSGDQGFNKGPEEDTGDTQFIEGWPPTGGDSS